MKVEIRYLPQKEIEESQDIKNGEKYEGNYIKIRGF